MSKELSFMSASDEAKRRKIIRIIIVCVLVVALIVGIILVFKSCKGKEDATPADATIGASELEAITGSEADADIECPEEDDPNAETGAAVDATSLKAVSGKANGIDVSKWQGKIDWAKVKASGVDFAIIRVGSRGGNGLIYKDSYADYNIQQAVKNNILVGVYFFSTATTTKEAQEEAAWTCSAIAAYPISYPVVYDCETYNSESSRMSGVSKAERTTNALAFLNAIKAAGYDGMLYSAKSDLENSTSWDTAKLEKSFKIWVAHYPATTYPSIKNPSYSGKYAMWQYTNMGKVPGVSGNVDMVVSYFTSSLAKAKDTSKKVAEATAPATDSGTYKSVSDTVTAKELVNLRDAATTKSNIVGTLKNGDILQRTATGSNGWSKLTYNGKTVYAITSYLTTDLSKAPSTATTNNANVVNGQTFKTASDKMTAKEKANLRNLPTTNGSTIEGTLMPGQYLTRTGIGDKGWSRLEYNGKVVYAVTSYLQTEAEAATATTKTTTTTVAEPGGIQFTDVNEQVTAKNETNLRTMPSSSDPNSTVVVTIKNGTYVTRTGISSNGWSRLDYNGQTVYAVSSLLMK